MSAVGLRVIDGGWKQEEARIEAIAFIEEAAAATARVHAILAQLEATYRIPTNVVDSRWHRAQTETARILRLANEARAEMDDLNGGNAA